MYVCMYACMHVCMYACMHVCMYACMYVYVCNVCVCVCVCVCVHQAITIDSKFPDALCGYGLLLRTIDRHEEAEAMYVRSLELDPYHVNTVGEGGGVCKGEERGKGGGG